MENFLSILISETSGSIRHDTLSLSASNGRAKVCLGAHAENAGRFTALGSVGWNDMVARLDGGHTRADGFHDASSFMAKDAREQSFGVLS